MLRPVDTNRTFLSYPAARPAEMPSGDRFERGQECPPDLRSAARLLDSRLRLDKAQAGYRLTSWCASPDGTVYSAYAEEHGERGYVAAATPEGAIRWELAMAEGRIQSLDLLPDGKLVIGASASVTTLSPEGRILDRQPGQVAGVWTDRAGISYWLDAGDQRLHGSALTSPVLQVRPTEGCLLARTAEAVHRIAAGGAVESSIPVPTFAKQPDTEHAVADAWALDGGDILLQKRSTTTVWPRFHHGMEHDPLFGGGGGMMLRHPDVTVRNTMVRVNPQGEPLWESADLGDKASPVVLRDGSTLFAKDRAVRRVGPSGQGEIAFQLDQEVRDLLPGQGDTLLVRCGDTVTRRAPSGEILATAQVREGLELRGEAPGGLFVFADTGGEVLWSCDPAAGTWSRCTDPEVDHSVALTVGSLEEQETPPPEVREEGEWITIGGVRLERRG